MGRVTFEIPAFLALLAFLAINYAVGYWLGLGLTGSIAGAFALAFMMPCISMILLTLIAPEVRDHRSDHARIQ